MLTWFSVRVPNALVALPLRLRFTTHALVVVSIAADSDVTSVPRMTDGPRTYFTPFGPHATVWLAGASHCGSV